MFKLLLSQGTAEVLQAEECVLSFSKIPAGCGQVSVVWDEPLITLLTHGCIKF